MIARQRRLLPAAAALVALYILLAFAAPRFFELENLRELVLTNCSLLLVATGMTLVIVIAQIDISVGSMFAVASVASGAFARLGVPVPLLPFGALAIGSALGAINGFLIAFVPAPSIVVTLATMAVWRQSLNWVTGGAWVEGLPANFQWFGLGQRGAETVIVIAVVLLFVAIRWASLNLSMGRMIYAVGSDNEAARLAGIATRKVIFAVFILIGALTGIAAVLNAIRFSAVPANEGINLELQAIAAVVVGGTPITGGQGSLTGTLIGVLLLGSITPALTFLGINASWGKAIQGAIILLTVFLEAAGSRRQRNAVVAAA
jgi:rhamnose transport system permease protein